MLHFPAALPVWFSRVVFPLTMPSGVPVTLSGQTCHIVRGKIRMVGRGWGKFVGSYGMNNFSNSYFMQLISVSIPNLSSLQQLRENQHLQFWAYLDFSLLNDGKIRVRVCCITSYNELIKLGSVPFNFGNSITVEASTNQ